MNTPDITPLVKGALALVMLALALGQYPRLAHWAQSQAVQAMDWREGLPYFFAQPRSAAKPHHVKRHAPQEGGRS